jgi:hypothetical protein
MVTACAPVAAPARVQPAEPWVVKDPRVLGACDASNPPLLEELLVLEAPPDPEAALDPPAPVDAEALTALPLLDAAIDEELLVLEATLAAPPLPP